MRRGASHIAATLLLLAPGAAVPAAERSAVLSTPHFAFFSDFDTNLNDALIAAGVARKAGKPELFKDGPEAACFRGQVPSVRAGWSGALDYYATIVSPANWNDSPQFLLRVGLVGFNEDLETPEARQYVDITGHFRAASAPAFRACRWKTDDEANHRFIDRLRPRLERHEETIAARLETLYGKRFEGLPVPVDVVAVVNWAGANSILRQPVGGHLLISHATEEAAALETVFHEASHLLMGHDAPVRLALEGAAKTGGVELPDDLWHVVLFYTTGESVRRVLADAGTPDYRPMVYGIHDRGGWTELREPIETAWLPYVEGKRDLPRAAKALVETLKKSGIAKPAPKRAA